MFNWLNKHTHILPFNIRNYYAQNHHSIRISEVFRWFQIMNFDSMVKRWEGMDNRKPCREAVCKCDHKTVGKWQFWLDAFHATSEPSMLCTASSAVLSRLYTSIWYFIFSVITLLIVLRILLARQACTLVISTHPTINLHATGERVGVNFGHWLWVIFNYTCVTLRSSFVGLANLPNSSANSGKI